MPRGVYKRSQPKRGAVAVTPQLFPPPSEAASAGRTINELWLRPAVAALKEQPPRVGYALERIEMAQRMCNWLATKKE
jgi:hypothetical protein